MHKYKLFIINKTANINQNDIKTLDSHINTYGIITVQKKDKLKIKQIFFENSTPEQFSISKTFSGLLYSKVHFNRIVLNIKTPSGLLCLFFLPIVKGNIL